MACLFVYVCGLARVCMSVSWHASGYWRATWGSWLFPSIIWVAGLKVTTCDLAASSFAHWVISMALPNKKVFFFFQTRQFFLLFLSMCELPRTKAFASSISYWAHFSGVLWTVSWASSPLWAFLSLPDIVLLSLVTLVAPLWTDAVLFTFFISTVPTRMMCSKGTDAIFTGVENSSGQKASALHLPMHGLLGSLIHALVSSHWSRSS